MSKNKWTRFYDMCSGGGIKESPYEYIYIEAPEEQAKIIFYNKFGHNPERVSCTCCGSDYSISKYSSLENQDLNKENVLIIYKENISNHERIGELPEEGYIWH